MTSRHPVRSKRAHGVAFFAASFVLTIAGSRAPVEAADPAPSPLVASPGVPAVCASPDAAVVSDVPSTFAFALADPHVLHFLRELDTASPSAAHATLDVIIRTASTPDRVRAASDVAKVCAVPADLVAAARADEVVSNMWNLDGFDTDAKLQAITRAVESAVVALGHGSAIATSDRTSILAPFAAIALPATISPVPCAAPNANASTLHVAPLQYPPLSAATGATGSVSLKIALSADGDVSSVTLVKDATGGGSGTKPLIEAAILSAAETTYRPSVVNCVGRPGLYLFRANFARK